MLSREKNFHLKWEKTETHCFEKLLSNGVKQQEKNGVINDPLGQTHSLASSEQCFRMDIVLFCYTLKSGVERTDRRTTCAKTMITTGGDCGLAAWIKRTV